MSASHDVGASRSRPQLLVSASAFLWGLQFAFLNPALALLLVALYHVSAAEVGVMLAAYNAGGFVAALALPAYADRRRDYLRPMLASAALNIVLAVLLGITSSVPVAVANLVLVGGPAGVGSALLFAFLQHAGASRSDIVNTRAFISFAWVAGPPLASFVIGAFGNHSVLLMLGAVAVLNVATTAAMLGNYRSPVAEAAVEPSPIDDRPVPRAGVVLIVVAFVALQATNNAAVSVMNLFVVQTLGLPVLWAGVALATAAAVEVPVLLLIGRVGRRMSDLALVVVGGMAGVAYYICMVFADSPAALISLQVLNAISFAVVAGVGISLFQRIIARPGFASGLYVNTRRIGSIVSGPIIGLASVSSLGYASTFAACAVLTAAATGVVALAARYTAKAAAVDRLEAAVALGESQIP